MISHSAHAGARVATDGSTWQCLVRRGMLFSECEAVEHVRLAEGGRLRAGGLPGAQVMILVVQGAVRTDEEEPTESFHRGTVLLLGEGARADLVTTTSSEVLCVRTLTGVVSRLLPERVPELAPSLRSI